MPLLSEMPFISRLPANYSEHNRIIQDAVQANNWIEIGSVAQFTDRSSRQSARYKAWESEVTLYEGKHYRIETAITENEETVESLKMEAPKRRSV